MDVVTQPKTYSVGCLVCMVLTQRLNSMAYLLRRRFYLSNPPKGQPSEKLEGDPKGIHLDLPKK